MPQWYKRVQDDREDVEDDKHLQTTDGNEKDMLLNDRRLTIREATNDVNTL